MKMDLLNAKLVLAAAAATTLLSGCASMNQGYSDVNGPSSALAFTSVTDPIQVSKWSGDRYLQMSLRSVDTYFFQVPDTGYVPGTSRAAAGRPGTVVIDRGSGDASYVDNVGTAPGPYQSETGSYKIIQYRPGHSR